MQHEPYWNFGSSRRLFRVARKLSEQHTGSGVEFYMNEGVKLFSHQRLYTHTLQLFCTRGNIEQLSNGLLHAYKLTDKRPRYKHEIYVFHGFFSLILSIIHAKEWWISLTLSWFSGDSPCFLGPGAKTKTTKTKLP